YPSSRVNSCTRVVARGTTISSTSCREKFPTRTSSPQQGWRLKTSTTSTPKHNGSSGVATQERCWKHWSNTHSNGAALANDARSEHPPRDQNDVSYDESAQSAARAPQPAVGLTPTAHGATWARSWVAAQQRVEPDNAPPAPGLSHNTLRQILRLSVAGERLRVELS